MKLHPGQKMCLKSGMRNTVVVLEVKIGATGRKALVADELGRESWVSVSQLEPPTEWKNPPGTSIHG